MRRYRFFLAFTVVFAGLAAGASVAAPSQLRCVLTDTATRPGSENRPLIVEFDEAAATLTAQDDDRRYAFRNVSISNVSINGQTDNVSLGIDRSSLGIVWQRYATDSVVTEYGRCRRSDEAPAPR